ncbi:hypothetical protein D3C76_1607200 [compost metagenome]
MYIHQNPQQFRDYKRRMCIIDMKCNLVGQRLYRESKLSKGSQNTLQASTAEEVLLLQPQQLAFVLRVIRIQELRDGFYGTLIFQEFMIV